ncbi:hypothetical protein [Aeromicrobium sp. UC242_57]|uniref:hypothetical protein n=1 Tax=Aeromicrobium sp. UC242_57 TaxID=3374624 RepID=UPI0037BD1BED
MAADQGEQVTCAATSARAGYTEATASKDSATVDYGTFVIGVPSISGTAQVGQTLTCVPAAGTPGAVSFGWTRDSMVLGAGAGYKLTAADLGKKATCVVTAVRAGYVDAVNQASSVTVVAAAPVRVTGLKPRVVGKMVERSTVTAQAGTVVPSTAVRTYQWLADGKKIKGATGRTFTLRKAQAGHQVSVRVTARAGAVSATATSPARRVGSSVKRLVVVRQVASGKKLTVTATGLTRGRRYVIWLGGQQRAAGVVGATGTVSRSVSFGPEIKPGTRRVRVSTYNKNGTRTTTIYRTIHYK